MEPDFCKTCQAVWDSSFFCPYVGKFGSGYKIKWTLRQDLLECVKVSDLLKSKSALLWDVWGGKESGLLTQVRCGKLIACAS